MGNVYVISDPHFGHKNMALHRGFSSVEEHDQYIVKTWNSIINKKDTLIILGDITMEKANYTILDEVKGFKKIVLGNHDQSQHILELLKHVNSVCSCMKYKGCLLSHIPIHPNELLRYRRNIHGHVHENTLSDKRYINVSCEVVDYKPQLISKLINNE